MSTVSLRVYDLSQGMARTMSPALLGKQIDGIWHTGIVVFGREYYFGGGICADLPGATPYGQPIDVQSMGSTNKTLDQFRSFLSSISHRFTFASYHLLDNNCNNFSDTCCRFLVDKGIPRYILDLPAQAMNSPLGPMIRPIIEQMQVAIQHNSVGHEVQLPPNSSAVNPSATEASHEPPVVKITEPQRAQTVSLSYCATPITLSKGDPKLITKRLLQVSPSATPADPSSLIQLSLSLPPQQAFPALDLIRLHIPTDPHLALQFATQFETFSSHFITPDKAPHSSAIMTLRAALNCFVHPAPTKHFAAPEDLNIIVEPICTALTHTHVGVRKTAALLALNLAGAHNRNPELPALPEEQVSYLMLHIVERLNAHAYDDEDSRALLTALIVLADGDPDAAVSVKVFGLLPDDLEKAKSCQDEATRKVATDLATTLRSGLRASEEQVLH
eukprot:GFKZ01007109.1.p1 GENE.GFKZ01007109.1~~GFKZ01007109.1.p1  ORF type:complete len:445 (-),score=56.15 GFKZ01007109.1:1609-2943(-)